MDRFREKGIPPWRRSTVPSWRRNLGEPETKPRLPGGSQRIEIKLLRQLALQCGMQLSFVDMAGRRYDARPEAIKALAGLWGHDVESPRLVRQALREIRERKLRQAVEPVGVAWDGKPTKLELRLPKTAEDSPVFARIHFEAGHSKSLEFRLGRLPIKEETNLAGTRFVTRILTLPAVPMGYHQFELEVSSRIYHSLIIAAPSLSYAPDDLRGWGVFMPIYALHSNEGWGAGNYTDFARLRQFVGHAGGVAISTPPLLATGYELPIKDPSPYSPLSRLFWNEFYLDIIAVPEFAACKPAQKLVSSAAFQKQLADLRSSSLIDYPSGMRLRRRVLELLSRDFFKNNSERRKEFESFSATHPRLDDYATFRAAMERFGTSWHQWDMRQRFGRLQPEDYRAATKNYHAFSQWLANEQVNLLSSCSSGSKTMLYLDLPVGVHPAGYDMWRERDSFAFPVSVGAPPDAFFTKGQNWGFAPLHPERIRERGYSYVREFLAFQMRHAGMLRIDHVMGLHRLYWIPPGFPATEGIYVQYPANELHAILNLESHRNRTVLVGEDLGTVPPEVTEAMARHQLRRMYVLQFEQQPDSREPLKTPTRMTVASLNTHDMATFAAHWSGKDIDDRARSGLLRNEQVREAKKHRADLHRHLVHYLRTEGWLKEEPTPESVYRACVQWLGASPAEVILLTLEDLWGELKSQNVPGTSSEKPNWRRKSRRSVEEIEIDPEIAGLFKDLQLIRSHSAS